MFDNSAVTDSHCQKQDVDSVARRYPGLANAPMGLATAKRPPRRSVTLLLLRRLTISRPRFRLPFTGTVIDFSSVSTLLNLQHLDCSGQLLHQYTAHLTSLASLQSLRSLDMSHCRDLSDCNLGMISALSRLTHLNLASCRGVTDTVLSDIASSLYELRHLNVRSCNAISDVGLNAPHHTGTFGVSRCQFLFQHLRHVR